MCGRLLRRLAAVALAAVMLICLGAAALAWRFSHGPIDVPWLAQRIEAAANDGTGGARVMIGAASIAWEGLTDAVDRPLDVRVRGIVARDPQGRVVADIPDAALSLALLPLLRGEIVARAVDISGPRLRVLRAEDGALSLDMGGSATAAATEPEPDAPRAPWTRQLLDALSAPDESGPASALRRVRVRDAELTVVDRALGATWRAPRATLDLRRVVQGVRLDATLDLALGMERSRVVVAATWRPGGTQGSARFSAVAPASLARAAPALEMLTPLDAPVAGEVDFTLDAAFQPVASRLALTATGGSLVLPGLPPVPFVRADLRATAGIDLLRLDALELALPGAKGAPGAVATASGRLDRAGAGWQGQVVAAVPALAIADLPLLWPAGLAEGARDWLVTNLTEGRIRDLQAAIPLSALGGLETLVPGPVRVTLRAEDATVHWLRPVPPLTGVSAEVAVTAEQAEIRVLGGRQGPIVAGEGRVTIDGLSAPDQTLALEVPVSASLPELVALLRHPRLKLFERRPLELRDPGGRVAGRLRVAFPLLAELPMEDVDIAAQARITDARVGRAIGPHDLTRGTLDLEVTASRLRVSGTATLAGIAVRLTHAEDLTAGPPAQVVAEQTLAGRAEWRQLAALGLAAEGVATGAVGLDVRIQRRRNGAGEAALRADLRETGLTFAPLAYAKPAGRPATAQATLRLRGNQPIGIDGLRVQAEGLDLRGSVALSAEGQPRRIELAHVTIGATRAAGEVRLPSPGQPLTVLLRGATLDLAPRLAARLAAPEGTAMPPLRLEAGFGRVLLGPGRELAAVTALLQHDGRRLVQLQATGRAGAGGAQLRIDDAGEDRRFTATAADAGALLRALGVTEAIRGGTLTLTGRIDDSQAAAPLSGTAEIADFRVMNAPALGRVLQGMTLYGLIETAQGPGLGFARLIAPFSVANSVLELRDARAFSASLGITARGRVELGPRRADLQGTIVPAYMFNSLLGNIPLVGRVFSAERGGGLFAAAFTLRGPLDDPQVSVNPLSALTPGFLRGLFQLPAGSPGAAPQPVPPNAQD